MYKEGTISIRKKYRKRFGSNPELLGEKFIQQFSILNPYYYEKYIIKKSEFKTIKKFLSNYFKIYEDSNLLNMMEIPISRFCRINDATNLIYRLIDIYISLEAMFSLNEELLGHRMFTRISFVLGDGKNNIVIYKFLQSLYNIRSKVVHGDDYEKDLTKISKLITFEDAIKLLDKITRICIKKYLNLLINLKIKEKKSLIKILDDKILLSDRLFIAKNSKGVFDSNFDSVEILINKLN